MGLLVLQASCCLCFLITFSRATTGSPVPQRPQLLLEPAQPCRPAGRVLRPQRWAGSAAPPQALHAEADPPLQLSALAVACLPSAFMPARRRHHEELAAGGGACCVRGPGAALSRARVRHLHVCAPTCCLHPAWGLLRAAPRRLALFASSAAHCCPAGMRPLRCSTAPTGWWNPSLTREPGGAQQGCAAWSASACARGAALWYTRLVRCLVCAWAPPICAPAPRTLFAATPARSCGSSAARRGRRG